MCRRVVCSSLVILVISIAAVLLTLVVWGIGFAGTQCGECNTQSYSIDSSCPWNNECYCVMVRVVWYPVNPSGSQHESMVLPSKYDPKCWTTDSYDTIMQYLQKSYPVGVNRTCYIDTSWGGPNHLTYDGNKLCNAPQIMFYIMIVAGSIAFAVALFLLLSVIVYVCRTTPPKPDRNLENTV